jgi:hypothetical protein
MITKQDIDIDIASGDVVLQNTFDIGAAKSLTKDMIADGGERCDSMRCMGYIPPEMWYYDPWLLQAKKAKAHGDSHEYVKMIKKFFEIHTALRMSYEKKYFNGVAL